MRTISGSRNTKSGVASARTPSRRERPLSGVIITRQKGKRLNLLESINSAHRGNRSGVEQ